MQARVSGGGMGKDSFPSLSTFFNVLIVLIINGEQKLYTRTTISGRKKSWDVKIFSLLTVLLVVTRIIFAHHCRVNWTSYPLHHAIEVNELISLPIHPCFLIFVKVLFIFTSIIKAWTISRIERYDYIYVSVHRTS